MTIIKNNHGTALNIDGTVIQAKGEANVPNWPKVKKNAVVAEWLRVGILAEAGESESEQPLYVDVTAIDDAEQVVEPANQPAVDEKAELIAKLDEAGIGYDKRWGVAKLRAALSEG